MRGAIPSSLHGRGSYSSRHRGGPGHRGPRTGVHGANEVNLKQKITSGIDLPINDLKDAARDAFVNAFRNGIYLARDDRPKKKTILNEGLNDTLRLTELYRDKVAPDIQPVAVERKFNVVIPGIPLPLAGRMDYEKRARVGDLKSATKSWPEGRINEEIQPIFYSYVHEHEEGIRPEFIYHILVALKKETKLQTQTKTATDADYRGLMARCAAFCQMVQAGVFPPANPSDWWCGEKWCGYYQTCPYVGNSLPKKEI